MSGSVTPALRNALAEVEPVGLAAADGTATGWVTVDLDGEVRGDGLARPLVAKLNELVGQGHQIRHVELAGKSWAVVTDQTAVASGMSASGRKGLEQALRAGQRIERIALTGDGGWLVTHANGFAGDGLPGGCLQALRNLSASPTPGAAPTRSVDEVAFGPNGAWIVIAGDALFGSGIAKPVQRAIAEQLQGGYRVDTVSLLEGGGWVVGSTGKRSKLAVDPIRQAEVGVRRGTDVVGIWSRLAAAKVPGAAVAAVVDDEVAWSTGYGVIAAGADEPVVPETVFQACSLSKPVTALGALRMVDAGWIDLDEDIQPHLAYEIPVHPMADRGRRLGASFPITLRQLLAHRAGIVGRDTTPDSRGRRFIKGGGGSVRVKNLRGTRVPSLEDSWVGRGGPPVMVTYKPGSKYSYSGAGYLVLQHLIEQLSGDPFDAWMGENVLAPLGMTSSSFALTPDAASMSCGHDTKGRTLPGLREVCPWSAAAGLHATASDLARFVVAMNRRGMIEDRELLSENLVEAMFAEGLGVAMAGKGANRRFQHTGSNEGFRSFLVGFPQRSGGVVVLANGRADTAVATDIANAVVEQYRWAR